MSGIITIPAMADPCYLHVMCPKNYYGIFATNNDDDPTTLYMSHVWHSREVYGAAYNMSLMHGVGSIRVRDPRKKRNIDVLRKDVETLKEIFGS